MKFLTLTIAAASIFLASCGGTDSTSNQATSETTETQTEELAVESPAVAALAANNQISITGNDLMKYSDTLFKVKAGEVVTLKMSNVGKLPKSSMGHNFVLLKSNVDVANFATEAMSAQDTDYIPASLVNSIIEHTKLLGPGESDEITFTINNPGSHNFLCSFPGHYGVMKGRIIAE
ncbi:plastocyanin/azurin family copper-binding protein [Pedobacter alpinus]|uniref:Plastocyanin/azurin family copper-binding protein n=1 Tax=Pedobacter alpinus TaxID=1590643 RepID=A0ABW5TTJ4_9SPHI